MSWTTFCFLNGCVRGRGKKSGSGEPCPHVSTPLQLLMIPLIMSVLYVWAQLNREMIVSFWFGTRFKVLEPSWENCHLSAEMPLQPRDVLSGSSRRGQCRAGYQRQAPSLLCFLSQPRGLCWGSLLTPSASGPSARVPEWSHGGGGAGVERRKERYSCKTLPFKIPSYHSLLHILYFS